MKFRNVILVFFIILLNSLTVLAHDASVDIALEFPEYFKIETVTSPILTANITDDTGNLYAPLSSKFKVISNSRETKEIYLKSESFTESGAMPSMFARGGRVYIAFTNVNKKPTNQALINCKNGSRAKESPGVVAYPITSIVGARTQYQYGKNNYKVFIENGITDILVNVGSHVLLNSFDKNDPRGFYQATLTLTEAEI